ncbi:hypothetical protein ACFLU8_04855 [Chloroflexota bacterium]
MKPERSRELFQEARRYLPGGLDSPVRAFKAVVGTPPFILKGRAGKCLEDGKFEPDSINDRVQRRLVTLAEKLRDFTQGEEKAKVATDNNESAV